MNDKSLPKLKKELQDGFNLFVRLRDKDKPCISCGCFKPLQAGHFFPVGAYDGLRYDEDNCHGEDAGCNCFDNSHLESYKKNLILKIGQSAFDALVERAEDYKRVGWKWSKCELTGMIKYYKSKVREMERG